MQKGRNWMQGDFYKGEDLGASYNKNIQYNEYTIC